MVWYEYSSDAVSSIITGTNNFISNVLQGNINFVFSNLHYFRNLRAKTIYN